MITNSILLDASKRPGNAPEPFTKWSCCEE